MKTFGLGRVERRRQGHEEDVFVLHDLQHDFCTGTARKLSVNGHHLLLSGCSRRFGTGENWASFCFSQNRSDGRERSTPIRRNSLRLYMGQNLFRHLSKASVAADESNTAKIVKVMTDLLADFCWLRGRGRARGRGGVVLDCRLALSAAL